MSRPYVSERYRYRAAAGIIVRQRGSGGKPRIIVLGPARQAGHIRWQTAAVDWSEAGRGDALYDLAILTLGHEEHLGDVVAGYGTDVDLDVIRAW